MHTGAEGESSVRLETFSLVRGEGFYWNPRESLGN